MNRVTFLADWFERNGWLTFFVRVRTRFQGATNNDGLAFGNELVQIFSGLAVGFDVVKRRGVFPFAVGLFALGIGNADFENSGSVGGEFHFSASNAARELNAIHVRHLRSPIID